MLEIRQLMAVLNGKLVSLEAGGARPLPNPSQGRHEARAAAGDRAQRIISALDRSNDAVLGLSARDQGQVGEFLSQPLPQVRNAQHEHAARGQGRSATASLLERRLFPGRPEAETHAGVAATLVSEAIPLVTKKRSFGSFDKFIGYMTPVINALILADGDRALAYYAYQNFIVETMLEFDWPLAEKYHWELFELVEDGSWDLVTDGEYNDRLFGKLARKYKGKRAGAAGAKPTRGEYVFCPLHGWGDHAAARCTRAVANGGDGTKSPTFREHKPSKK